MNFVKAEVEKLGGSVSIDLEEKGYLDRHPFKLPLSFPAQEVRHLVFKRGHTGLEPVFKVATKVKKAGARN